MSIASEPKLCPKCGAAIPAEAPQGLCPKCLLLEISAPTDAGQGGGKSVPPSREELAAAFPQLEILELIGQGGMGFVFKARQPKLDRFVALKILPQSLAADPAFAERFTREGRLLARLNHPNIVTVHDFGVASAIRADVEPGFQSGGKGADGGEDANQSNAPGEPPPLLARGHPLPRSERGRGTGEEAQPGSEVQSEDLRAENSPSKPGPDPRGRMPRSTSGKMPEATGATEFFYLLMEYVDGVNLRQAMKAGRFTPEQALAVVPKICEALQFAHNEGILHRDIKPENILLDTKGRVKIADFGIAKLIGVDVVDSLGVPPSGGPDRLKQELQTALTGSGKTLGTPNYMAPEQIATPGAVDHRADIYSLGVVFYEMLTGELPLGRFAPPSQKSAADPRLDDVVLRALEKEPNRRTQSAGEVKTQVETIVTEKRPPIIPASTASLTAKSFLRRGMLVGVIVFFIVISCTILATFLRPKTYMSESKLFLRPLNQLVKPEISLDSSDEILRKVVEDLNLKERWAIRIDELEKRDPSLLSNRNSDVSVEQYRKMEAIILLKRSLKITQPSNSSVVSVSFSGPNPTEATEILGAVVLGYLGNAAQYQSARISLIQAATSPFPSVRPLPLIFPGGIVGLILGLTSGLITTFFSRRRAGQSGRSTGEEAAREVNDERERASVAESLSGRSTQPWMKWLGTGLVVLGIPVGIFGLVMLYLVLQDKSWNPAPSEAFVCFSAWIGTFILFLSGFFLIKASRAACGNWVKGLLAIAVVLAAVLGGGLVVEVKRQIVARNAGAITRAVAGKVNPSGAVSTNLIRSRLEFRRVADEGDSALSEEFPDPGDKTGQRKLRVRSEVLMDGSAIAAAHLQKSPVNRGEEVAVLLTAEGQRQFQKLTKENIGKGLAILFDRKLLSAPVINSEIRGASISIAGNLSAEDMETIVFALNAPPPHAEDLGKNLPGFDSPVEFILHKGPAEKISGLNLDTKQLVEIPPEFLAANPTNTLYDWTQKNGIDLISHLSLARPGVWGFNLRSLATSSHSWTNLPARLVEEQVGIAGVAGLLAITGTGEFPATYLFKTTEGNVGILQILGLVTQPKGVKIRYKLVQNGG